MRRDDDAAVGAGGRAVVRQVFPIYHIPPTDCPYETDTFFFISQPAKQCPSAVGCLYPEYVSLRFQNPPHTVYS